MKNKLIRLTEGDLHRIVKESVKRVLKEADKKGWSGRMISFETDPSKANDERDVDVINSNAQALQKGRAKDDQDNSNAHDTRKAARAWVGKEGTKKKGQFPSPKEMKKRTRNGRFYDKED